MTDMKIGSEQLSREYALKILKATPDEAGHSQTRSPSASLDLSSDAVLEAANAQVIKILIDALGNADVSVSANSAATGVTTGDGNDAIRISAGSVAFAASGEGNDSIAINTSGGYALLDGFLLSAVDLVEAGAGDDTISVSSHGNVDRIEGGIGNDHITISSATTSQIGAGQHGIDRVNGGAGEDKIILTSASDVTRAFGGEGNDSITVGARDSALGIYGGEGNDTIAANAEYASGFYGDDGNDTITIEAQNASGLYGGDGDDTIVVDAEHSVHGVYGGDGNDVIHLKADALGHVTGGAGDDYLILESAWSERNTVFFSEGDGHDTVETNKPLEIRRFNSDGTDVAETDATVRRNDDGTVTIAFPGGGDSITVKFTGGSVAGDIVVEQFKGSLIVHQQ